ncbi:hypothetical protein Hypma_005799 [Hypsizygus marmoreus]|uniref:Uncharacterized protein n=1 Tax=Hypsizygus marmoreus TaxID=39966 RepID=A0A369KA87_HYPMA|nr:hypothetical protein Hypma_005799 [Hypsizygus marmoreus]
MAEPEFSIDDRVKLIADHRCKGTGITAKVDTTGVVASFATSRIHGFTYILNLDSTQGKVYGVPEDYLERA